MCVCVCVCVHIYKPVCIYIYIYSKSATVVGGNQNALFSIATTPKCWGRRYCFPWIAPLYP